MVRKGTSGALEEHDSPRMRQLPRSESWAGSAGTPQRVSVDAETCRAWEVFLSEATTLYSPPGLTPISIVTASLSTKNPSWAAAPDGGVRLKTGTLSGPSATMTAAVPTAVSLPQLGSPAW